MPNSQFETTIQAQMQAAMDAISGHPEVTDIYIYMGLTENSGGSGVMFGANGKLADMWDLDDILTVPIGSRLNRWHDRLSDAIHEPFGDLLKAYWDEPVWNGPSRIVAAYNLAEQRMEANLSYTLLDPTGELTDAAIKDIWMARAIATGNLSVEP